MPWLISFSLGVGVRARMSLFKTLRSIGKWIFLRSSRKKQETFHNSAKRDAERSQNRTVCCVRCHRELGLWPGSYLERTGSCVHCDHPQTRRLAGFRVCDAISERRKSRARSSTRSKNESVEAKLQLPPFAVAIPIEARAAGGIAPAVAGEKGDLVRPTPTPNKTLQPTPSWLVSFPSHD